MQNQLSEYELEQLCSASTKTSIPKAWVEIAACLPERSLMSIHNFVHRRFNPDNYKGNWTHEEEQRLLELVEEHGRKWNEISKHFNRTERNLRDKYR